MILRIELFLLANSCFKVMPIDPILTLPYELVAEVLTDWLKLESVVHLDSAYCKRAIRHHFLQMLSWRRLKLFSTTKSKASFILWMLARKIKISSLVCTRTLCMAEVSRSVKKADSTVRKVVLNCLVAKDAVEVGAVLAYHCTNIRILRIVGCLMDLSLQNILEKNKELRELLLSGGTNLEKYSLKGLKCPKLERIYVESSTGAMDVDNYEAFLGMSKNLQQFTFPYVRLQNRTPCMAMTFNQLRSLSFSAYFDKQKEDNGIDIAHSFPSVTNLSLSDATDGLVLAMARNCAVIRTLSLQGYSTSFTPISLQAIASHHALSLQVLYLNHCPKITNMAVTALLQRCPNLHTLSVDEVDDEEFNKLILSSAFMECFHDHPSLSTLLITGQFLMEETMHALSQHGGKLTTLGINCHYNFDQLTSVLEQCTALRTLYVPKAHPGHVKAFRAVNPSLSIHTGARVKSVFAYKCSNYPMYMSEVS